MFYVKEIIVEITLWIIAELKLFNSAILQIDQITGGALPSLEKVTK
jgi:hypothetical protein